MVMGLAAAGTMSGQKTLAEADAVGTPWPEVTAFSLDTVPVEYNTATNEGLTGCVWNSDGTRLYAASDDAASGALWHNSPNYTTPYVPEDDTSVTRFADNPGNRPREMAWGDSGTTIIVAHFVSNTNNIRKYTHTGTAYNPTTSEVNLTPDQQFSATGIPRSLYVKPDGTQMWYCNNNNGDIYEVNMSTPWDLTSGSMGNNSGNLSEGTMHSMKWSPDGLRLYALASTDVLYEYTASTAWDITSISYASRSLDVANSRNATSFDVSFDATKMVVCYYSTASTANELAHYTT